MQSTVKPRALELAENATPAISVVLNTPMQELIKVA